jgi:hypothetical protein
LRLFYPTTGNFITFVGNWSSKSLLERSIGSFRSHTKFPSEGIGLPSWRWLMNLVEGFDWSDHRSFWQHNYPAIMVTDTAAIRYGKFYHTRRDTPDKIDFDRMTRVVYGLVQVVKDLAKE